MKKIPGTAENWENGKLGQDERYVRVSEVDPAEVDAALDILTCQNCGFRGYADNWISGLRAGRVIHELNSIDPDCPVCGITHEMEK